MAGLRRCLLVTIVVAITLVPTVVRAEITGANGDNVQSGHNSADSDQDGDAEAGSGVGGQQIDVSAGGDANVSATNTGDRVNVDTGDAEAGNDLAGYVGQASSEETVVGPTDIVNAQGNNIQEGGNEFDFDQSADATTGDGVGGQIIGVTAGRDAVVRATNTPRHVDIDTGDAEANNDASTVAGQTTALFVGVSDIINPTGNNIQEGTNSVEGDQDADADTGDGVGGQDLDVGAGRDADVWATNAPQHVSVSTGDADADNDSASFVGQAVTLGLVVSADLINVTAPNIQEGDNLYEVDQDADASTGDALSGQRAAVGGRRHVDVRLTDEGRNNNISSGDADISQDEDLFVGAVVSLAVFVGP